MANSVNNYTQIVKSFINLTKDQNVVLACRVSPKQKGELVELLKKNERDDITILAIGDGANDVNMINAAHIGIGING